MLSLRLSNSLTFFIDIVKTVVKPFLDKFVVIFIDGILIYSKPSEEDVEP